MKKFLAGLALAIGLSAPAAAALFPSSIGSNDNLWVAVNNCYTTLSVTINASTPTVTAAATTNFPSTGYFIIDTEIIKYTGKTSNTFTGCTRGADGTAAASHTSGAIIYFSIVADHHNVLKDEIIAIEDYFLNSGTEIHIDTTNARVGINNAAPAYTLDVGGTINLTGALTAGGAISGTDGTFSGAVAGATFNSGNGAYEIYAQDQDIQTTDYVTHAGLTATYGVYAATMTSTGLTTVQSFKMATGASDGYVLTSDADGNATWGSPAAPVAIGADVSGADPGGVLFATMDSDLATDSDFIYSTATQVMSVIGTEATYYASSYNNETGITFYDTPYDDTISFDLPDLPDAFDINPTAIVVSYGIPVYITSGTVAEPALAFDYDSSNGFNYDYTNKVLTVSIGEYPAPGIAVASFSATGMAATAVETPSIFYASTVTLSSFGYDNLELNYEYGVRVLSGSVLGVPGVEADGVTPTGSWIEVDDIRVTTSAACFQTGGGTAALPSITSYDQGTTGLYFPPGEDLFGVSILGVGIASVTANGIATSTMTANYFAAPEYQSVVWTELPSGQVIETGAGELIAFEEYNDDLNEWATDTYTATYAQTLTIDAYGSGYNNEDIGISGDQLQINVLQNGVAISTYTCEAEETYFSWDASTTTTVAVGDTITIKATVIVGGNSFTIDTDSYMDIVGPVDAVTFRAKGVDIASVTASGFYADGFYGNASSDSVMYLYSLGIHSNPAVKAYAHLGRGEIDLTNGSGTNTITLVGHTGTITGTTLSGTTLSGTTLGVTTATVSDVIATDSNGVRVFQTGAGQLDAIIGDSGWGGVGSWFLRAGGSDFGSVGEIDVVDSSDNSQFYLYANDGTGAYMALLDGTGTYEQFYVDIASSMMGMLNDEGTSMWEVTVGGGFVSYCYDADGNSSIDLDATNHIITVYDVNGTDIMGLDGINYNAFFVGGSAASPGIFFISTSSAWSGTTGFYATGDDTVGITIQGASAATVTSSGIQTADVTATGTVSGDTLDATTTGVRFPDDSVQTSAASATTWMMSTNQAGYGNVGSGEDILATLLITTSTLAQDDHVEFAFYGVIADTDTTKAIRLYWGETDSGLMDAIVQSDAAAYQDGAWAIRGECWNYSDTSLYCDATLTIHDDVQGSNVFVGGGYIAAASFDANIYLHAVGEAVDNNDVVCHRHWLKYMKAPEGGGE